jgi:hypothetical protein
MFNSLKKRLNIDIQIRPYASRSGTGNIVYGTAVDTKCYLGSETKLVVTKEGVEAISNIQVYLSNDIAINILDNIVIDDVDYPIKSLVVFYRNGSISAYEVDV